MQRQATAELYLLPPPSRAGGCDGATRRQHPSQGHGSSRKDFHQMPRCMAGSRDSKVPEHFSFSPDFDAELPAVPAHQLAIRADPISQVLERQQQSLTCSQCLPAEHALGGAVAQAQFGLSARSCGFSLSWCFSVLAGTHGLHGHASSFRLVDMGNWCGCSIAR